LSIAFTFIGYVVPDCRLSYVYLPSVISPVQLLPLSLLNLYPFIPLFPSFVVASLSVVLAVISNLFFVAFTVGANIFGANLSIFSIFFFTTSVFSLFSFTPLAWISVPLSATSISFSYLFQFFPPSILYSLLTFVTLLVIFTFIFPFVQLSGLLVILIFTLLISTSVFPSPSSFPTYVVSSIVTSNLYPSFVTTITILFSWSAVTSLASLNILSSCTAFAYLSKNASTLNVYPSAYSPCLITSNFSLYCDISVSSFALSPFFIIPSSPVIAAIDIPASIINTIIVITSAIIVIPRSFPKLFLFIFSYFSPFKLLSLINLKKIATKTCISTSFYYYLFYFHFYLF